MNADDLAHSDPPLLGEIAVHPTTPCLCASSWLTQDVLTAVFRIGFSEGS
jgi:hypothetical protein